jgi:hypothetical protein
MEYYGNILTLYNSTSAQLKEVGDMINDNGFPFEQIENTFFFGTSSIKKSKDFQRELSLLPLDFTCFFLSNPDGSTIRTNGIDPQVAQHIDDIFFNDI